MYVKFKVDMPLRFACMYACMLLPFAYIKESLAAAAAAAVEQSLLFKKPNHLDKYTHTDLPTYIQKAPLASVDMKELMLLLLLLLQLP